MAIYRNNSTFPTYLFSLFENHDFASFEELILFILESDSLIKKTISKIEVNRPEGIHDLILQKISDFNNQYLFGYLICHLPLLYFSNIAKFNEKQLERKSINDVFTTIRVLNWRFELNSLQKYFSSLKNDNNVRDVDESLFVNNFINIAFKYGFVQLSKSIYASRDIVLENMNFKEEIIVY